MNHVISEACCREAVANALAQARLGAVALGALLAEWTPRDLAAAYTLQREVAGLLGEVRGWKVSALTAAQQQVMGVPCPVGGPLLAPWVHDTTARFELARFIVPKLECEFAFELGHDLPPRAEPYSRAEVIAAVRALRIGVEVTDSRLPPASPFLAELSDAFNNGAYVVGPACTEWQAIDFAQHTIVLSADGLELSRGSGLPVLDGDPLGAVLLLANAQPPDYGGLRAGHIVTTGTCTGALPVPGPCTVAADFGALGRIVLSFE
jgi:2-keto-4-pentenoate hydratase